jgi:hypothetical protein
MPQQQRQLALLVLRQEVLNVHLLDLVLAVRIDLGRYAAGREHDLLDRLAGNLVQPPADMERAHVAKVERLFRLRKRGCGCERERDAGEYTTHDDLPRCDVIELLFSLNASVPQPRGRSPCVGSGGRRVRRLA